MSLLVTQVLLWVTVFSCGGSITSFVKSRCTPFLKSRENDCSDVSIWISEIWILLAWFAISAKGDNFCDFLIVLQHFKSLLK